MLQACQGLRGICFKFHSARSDQAGGPDNFCKSLPTFLYFDLIKYSIQLDSGLVMHLLT